MGLLLRLASRASLIGCWEGPPDCRCGGPGKPDQNLVERESLPGFPDFPVRSLAGKETLTHTVHQVLSSRIREEVIVAKMPKRAKQHVSRDQAVLLAKRCLPPSWIVRDEAQDNDYGIDLEVELADTEVAGWFFKVQVKGHQYISWTTEGTYLQPVREETLNYWRALPVPVVLFVGDLNTGAIYWASGKVPSGDTGVRVMRRSAIPGDALRLASYVTDWLYERSAKAQVYGLPFFADAWEKVLQQTGLDCFMPLGPDEYSLLQYVYRQTKLVHDALGLLTDMLPWAIWPARSRATFGNGEDLYWGTYDEVVAYLRPLVEEALAVGKKQLDAEEPTTENTAAKHWAGGYQIHWAYNEFDALGIEFWKRVDEQLRRREALLFEAAKGVKFSRDSIYKKLT
jgi:hypothetical protein